VKVTISCLQATAGKLKWLATYDTHALCKLLRAPAPPCTFRQTIGAGSISVTSLLFAHPANGNAQIACDCLHQPPVYFLYSSHARTDDIYILLFPEVGQSRQVLLEMPCSAPKLAQLSRLLPNNA